MRKGFFIAAVLVLGAIFMAGSALAQMEVLKSLDFYAVQKVTIEKKEDGYWADVLTVLKNRSKLNFRLRNFKFTLSFLYGLKEGVSEEEAASSNPPLKKEKQTLSFGTADVKIVDLPQAISDVDPTLTSLPMKVFLGTDNEDTLKRILQFISLVGNPRAVSMQAVLKGTGEIGTEVDKGWIYQGNMILELILTPERENQWLLK